MDSRFKRRATKWEVGGHQRQPFSPLRSMRRNVRLAHFLGQRLRVGRVWLHRRLKDGVLNTSRLAASGELAKPQDAANAE